MCSLIPRYAFTAANIMQRAVGQRDTESRRAWYALLEAMRDVDVEYLSPAANIYEDDDIAEGHLFSLSLIGVGLDAYVLNADPKRPHFKDLFNPNRKWLVDQPDAKYYTATIDPDQSYRITGRHAGEVRNHLLFLGVVYQHPPHHYNK